MPSPGGKARLLIEQAGALAEPPEDPLLLFSVLYGYWAVSYVAFDGSMMRKLAEEFLARAEAQRATLPLTVGHRVMGQSLLLTGDIAQGRVYLDQAIALYDPAKHRPLTTLFGQDVGVPILSYRSWALWFLGYPDAALRDADVALKNAREIGHAPTLMYALNHASWTKVFCQNYTTANVDAIELAALADERDASFWKALGLVEQGGILALTAKASEAVHTLTSGITALRSTGATVSLPSHLSHLARACAELGQFDDAWRWIGEAIAAVETTRERWYEAEVYRIAGEIALMSLKPDETKAQRFFERTLAVARQQQAKSWELRASMSLARLWRDQGKVSKARELLAPVYGWFTEGFDTRDLKEAKVLLEELGREDRRLA